VKSSSKANLPLPVVEARRHVDAWRRTRLKRGPMPRDHWEEATTLVKVAFAPS